MNVNNMHTLQDISEEFTAAGQRMDADEKDRRQMNQALSVLADTTAGMLHRKGEEVLEALLPMKHHHVIHLRLTPHQERLYMAYFEVRPLAQLLNPYSWLVPRR